MRKYLLLLAPLLLAGCVKQSASYSLSEERDHALSVRAEQEYLWDKNITLSLVAANLPECQRAVPLEKVHQDDVAVELFRSGETVFNIRSGEELVQLDMQSCTRLADPAPTELGEAVGVFRLGDGNKMQFEAAETAAPATPPATRSAPDAE
ncbi:hypothetical protein KY495_09730 [Massilia sp. PAMC28688]|uniref:hypothetical protein n=1 Tax=Massilia sp. PAMC28688 TaxID=2861283 RepID=UPI001C639863|nr:hypothetical protein [Massilia sp. PAMC28688]QYF95400.1 hypothetical protein KY495_09730 [Massilia sp. PAMC28688]